VKGELIRSRKTSRGMFLCGIQRNVSLRD
jgi:hypothetical protein